VLKESEEEPLTLEERMHLQIRDHARTLKKSNSVFGLIFFISILITIMALDNAAYLEDGLTEEEEISLIADAESLIYLAVMLLVILSGLLVFGWIYGKKQGKKLEELVDGFIRKSYLINFETAVPKGSTRVEKILNVALKVFPELKETEKKAKQKGKQMHYELNKEVGDFVYELSLKTKSDELFLVIFLEEQSFDELKAIVKNTNKKFGKNKIFRLICVGTDFTQVFTDHSAEEIMDDLSRSFKLDMIEEHEKGYFMAWID